MSETWYASPHGFLPLLLLLGLCFGSFLNVVIHRLPRGESLWRPRSRCPVCHRSIRAWENIPILSYLILRGRCAGCRARISLRYPFVELLGGVSVFMALIRSDGPFDASIRFVFLLTMVAITFIDLDHRIIPDSITLPGILIGLLLAPMIGTSRIDALLGAVAGFGILLGLALAYRAIRKIDGMGMGDVKLAGMVGAFLGWKGVLATLLFGSLLGSIFGVALLVSKRGSGTTAVPFGTFLAPAAAILLLYGATIWAAYLGLFPTVSG